MLHILDPQFKYVPSHKTDLRETFARIQREQAACKSHKLATAANDETRELVEIHTPDPSWTKLLNRV